VNVPEDDVRWSSEMSRVIAQAQRIVERGETTFFAADNPVEFLAARMIVIELDVAADHLSPEFKEARPGIPWRALARARDKYAHHYEDIDRGVLWELLVGRLPRISRELPGS
jgi:uncharacterized protein with HEPN domain